MELAFVKLGGSLITDKTRPYTLREEKLEALAGEIASAFREKPDLQLVVGHGSGSFGHQAASQYHTRMGVSKPEDWIGFSEVWYQASKLDRFVVEALRQAGVPVLTFSPAASVTAHDGKVFIWDTNAIQMAISKGLVPIIHGDVVFDEIRGGTVLSTEDLFLHLANRLHPRRILLAGLESGVWADFPARLNLIKEISPDELSTKLPDMGWTEGTDVTGGMHSKVISMLNLVQQMPEMEILIFSGNQTGNLHQALLGENIGTRLHSVVDSTANLK